MVTFLRVLSAVFGVLSAVLVVAMIGLAFDLVSTLHGVGAP